MKGLFIKDIALMKHNKRLLMIIFLTVLFLLMSGMNSSFLMGYMPFICCILTMGTISYDEYENGLPFLFTLPVSRKEYVKEKFLLGFLTGGAGFLVIVVSQSNFITAQLLCFTVQITSAHTSTQIAGGFLNLIHRFKNVCLKNCNGNI